METGQNLPFKPLLPLSLPSPFGPQIHLSGEMTGSNNAKTSTPIFLLIVGMDHMLVGLVMEGCGLTPETTPTLDRVYVNEAKQLIAKLDSQDIFTTCTTKY